ncbi:hemolysin family protein [Rhodoplanes sp. Z2-YC6860]|uniref:hemolysin family protein n=1 Tax=Rhodoplanes sp. Z2-YC6860 TaxID=674703 RepID=UPI00078C8705|nr:hemolysin family protein [Rhodoplanes sp. Z2-YC6860]AMN38567.1 magnesium and cobalt efflux protein CorC [Rhodoplanes sp. Z2-YC6860]
MPDSDASGRSAEPAGALSQHRNLPVPVARTANGDREGFFARLARAIFGWRNGPTRADIEVVLEAAGPGEAGVSPEERTMIRNILALRGRRIEDVMVPRGDIIAVQQDIPLGELVKVFEKANHSRLVAYDDTLDDPMGMVHIRDLIAFMTAQAAVDPQKATKRKKPRPAGLDFNAIDLSLPLSSTKIMREMLFVPPSMPAIDLLEKMQATRIHLALVVDEYGGTDGLVSMEDIVEQIVGEIEDEHDEDELPAVVRENDGSYVADARASLDDVTAAIGVAFDVGDAAESVDTIGGYLMAQVGRLPLRGELVPGPEGFEIEVLDSDPRRVKKVRIHRSKNRTIERDREGRRRFSGTEDTTAAAIAPPTSPPEPPSDDAAKAQPSADSSAPQKS